MKRKLTSTWVRGGLALFAFLFCASLAQAQLTRGTIIGTVNDQSGAAVPGAAVTLTHVDTGSERQAETNATGRYEAPNLSAGSYEVRATLSGFQTSVRAGIELSIGRTAVVDIVLQVGEVTQAVTVTGEVAFVETTSATVSNLVDVQKVEDLPLNNRDLTQLTFLQPGVLRVPSSGDQSEFSGLGDKLTVGGARGTHNLYLLDGVSNGDISNNAQGASSAYIGAETVAELQVITNNYSAEYQSAAGAIISAISKSGTNSLHGSLFEFIRNDNLDAANFFTNAFGLDKPEFKRNQFGGSIGGPIVPDRTFFFASYEGLRERLNETDTARVLSAEVHQGFVGGEYYGVAPEVAPYLALYPMPGQGNALLDDFGDGTALVAGAASTPTTDDFLGFKIDHHFSDSNQISATYNFDDAERNGPFSILGEVNNGAGTGGAITSLRHIFGVGLTSIISPTTLNEFHFGFSHTVTAGDIALASRRDWGDLTFGADRSGEEAVSQGVENFFGQINPGDASSIGFRTGGSNYLQRSLSFKEGLSLNRGNHSLRAGVDVIRFHYDQRSCSRGCYGIYDFNSVEDFLTAKPDRFQGMVPDDQGMGLSPPHIMQQYQFGSYFQDNWQVSNSLTLNLGMRYEFVTVPSGDESRLSALIHFGDANTTVGPPYVNATKKSFSPRFGFAWAPGDRRTSLRGGYGIFYVHPRLYHIRTSLQELPPFVQVRRLDNDDFEDDFGVSLEFPTAYQNQRDLGAQRNNLRAMEYDQKKAYIHRWSLTLQREVSDWVLSAGYTGSRALHLLNQNRMNLRKWDGWPDQPPAGTPKQWSSRNSRIQCCFGEARIQTSNGNSFYHGLAVGAQRRLSRGLQMQFAYTLSKNIDQGAGVTSGGDELPQSQRGIYGWDMHLKRGLSSQDIRNSFVTNFSYEFPRGDFGGAGNALVNGWQFNGIITLTDGHPLSVFDGSRAQNSRIGSSEGLRADLIPGGDNNRVFGGPDKYFDDTQFVNSQIGFFGNAGRNTVTSPGLATFDLSVFKDFNVSENSNIQFRTEMFNLFNRANFATPDMGIFSSSSTPTNLRRDGNAARINSTRGPGRQIQFGLRYTF